MTERLRAIRHRKRSAKPVWAYGWSSQTRRRRPEESVQTDQRGLRAQCDLRGSAALVRRCAASPASRPYGPATPSTAPPGSRDPRVEPDISSSSPVAPHGRGGAASTKVSISTGSTREPGPVAVRQRWPGYRIPASPNAYPAQAHRLSSSAMPVWRPTTGRLTREPAQRERADELKWVEPGSAPCGEERTGPAGQTGRSARIFSGRRRGAWLGQPHVHTGVTERLPGSPLTGLTGSPLTRSTRTGPVSPPIFAQRSGNRWAASGCDLDAETAATRRVPCCRVGRCRWELPSGAD